jgi:uncharacterized protein (UPF0548 family)
VFCARLPSSAIRERGRIERVDIGVDGKTSTEGRRRRGTVFSVRRPQAPWIAAHLADLAGAPFTYPEVGATRGGRSSLPPSVVRDYDVDHYEVVLGTGRELFERARRALLAWGSFDIPWLELQGASTPVRADQIVATLVRAAGLWVLNPCRVTYVAVGPDEPAAFGYGTLPGHAEVGEERFLVAHDPETDSVRYEILAFSRPGHPLSRLGRPYTRSVQRRFGRSSLSALARACA